jgi:hypothetical protein
MTEKQIAAAARAMMKDLCKTKNYNHGCLLNFIPTEPENVVVRGHIDLTSLARVALKAAERVAD